MSRGLKVGTKVHPLSSFDSSDSSWKFSQRPGGWWLAERRDEDGNLIRFRFMMVKTRSGIQWIAGGRGASGEWIERCAAVTNPAMEVIDNLEPAASENELVAEFPAKLRKILATTGDRVQRGDPLFLVEAMKMEFDIRAPFSGRVKQLYVKEGQQLSAGDRFLELEVLE